METVSELDLHLLKLGSMSKKTVEIRGRKEQHNKMVREERREYQKKSEMAILHPSDNYSIIVDGADQSAFGLLHFTFTTKETKGQSLGVKLIGVLEHGPCKRLNLFLMTEQYETGANHVIESLHRALTLRAMRSPLPKTLFLQFENCTRENKNR